MKILNKLTLENLKKNKKRTIVTIFGIMLSIALICAITTFIASFQQGLINRTIAKEGNYHIIVSNVKEEQAKYIRNNVNIETIATAQVLGYAKYKTEDRKSVV